MPNTTEEYFSVKGGRPIKGTVRLAGAKNAATKMLVASLLTDEECTLENFPDIGDTRIVLELCEVLGSKFDFKDSTVTIRTEKIKTTKVEALSRKNRIPILALGPLLTRMGEGEVPIVGGDKIGPRPVDMHLTSLEALGAEVEIGTDSYHARAPHGLKGAEITFRYPSVGATEQVIMAAVLARGKTIVRNAAVEPEITDLIKVLQKMGAIIELGTNRVISIYGVERLRGFKHRIMSDRNEAVSFACLAVATDGDVFAEGAEQEHLITFLNSLRRIGGEYEVRENGIRFWRAKKLTGTKIETETHPGFMTDWQQPFTVLLTQSEGASVVHETVYEDRFGYTKDLNLMGANIKVVNECLGDLPCRFKDNLSPHSAIIEGPTKLHGREITVPDIRAGIAHLIAALVAEGESTIRGISEIDRGYERIDERFRSLGASIERKS
ncbi:UDP-N-acetylglucosamine 1-carboxyvinyltransferase [Patescibacteria group bacterium]|nr:UDP-N-acetylglucosamine 1-carboxyvinyltransferase [Patescibacteria group bacterium]